MLLLTDTGSKLSAEPCREQSSRNDRALFHLALGQTAQAEGMWYEALEHYAMGLSCASKEPGTVYLLYNNAAHCRNMLGFYLEAEKYCRLAIKTDSNRHEAYISLGGSLLKANVMSQAQPGALWRR
jgi:tetratricopeptide (TPR) repeat protein